MDTELLDREQLAESVLSGAQRKGRWVAPFRAAYEQPWTGRRRRGSGAATSLKQVKDA